MEGMTGVTTRAAIGGLLEILARALLSGIGVAVAMSLAILALCATTQAATLNDPETEPWSVALTTSHEAQAADVGALWAKAPLSRGRGAGSPPPTSR